MAAVLVFFLVLSFISLFRKGKPMSFFHSLFSGLAAKFAPAVDDAKVELLKHDSWNSVRTIAVVAFVAYLLYLNHLLLTPDNLALTAKLIALLIVCNTVTKVATLAGNAWIQVTKVREFSKDNTLSAEEAASLGDGKTSTDS